MFASISGFPLLLVSMSERADRPDPELGVSFRAAVEGFNGHIFSEVRTAHRDQIQWILSK